MLSIGNNAGGGGGGRFYCIEIFTAWGVFQEHEPNPKIIIQSLELPLLLIQGLHSELCKEAYCINNSLHTNWPVIQKGIILIGGRQIINSLIT
jgi:hypothetical protein